MTESTNEETDEEGLLRRYDVILCGTGLVESIVAAALARAGRKVLHVDGAEYYGQLDAVWTLPYVVQHDNWVKKEVKQGDTTARTPKSIPLHPLGATQSLEILPQHDDRYTYSVFKRGTRVTTPYGRGVVQGIQSIHDDDGSCGVCYYTLTVDLTDGAVAQSDRNPARQPRVSIGISPSWVQETQTARTSSHDDDDDDTTLFIHTQHLHQHHGGTQSEAAATAEKLLRGPESRSIALDVTPLAIYAAGPAVNGLVSSSVSEYLEFKSLEGLLYYDGNTLQPVPCSKNDVFSSRLLSPMDKRRLMKFLQTALDFATAQALQEEEEADVGTDTAPSTGDGLQTVNERHLNQGRSLSRPQNKTVAGSDLEELQALCAVGSESQLDEVLQQRLSPSLAPLVQYALALANDANTPTAVGVRQLCAHMLALGRFGGTAFLVPMYGSGELAQAFCRSAAVFGATYLLRRAATGIVLQEDGGSVQGVRIERLNVSDEGDEEAATSKMIACDHVIVSSGAMVNTHPSKHYVVRRISLLHGKPLAGQQQRHITIFPPGSFPGQTSVIHGLILDEYSRVVPMLGNQHGCTLVHLTTTITTESRPDDDTTDKILSSALAILLAAGDAEEIFHKTFRYALNDDEDTEPRRPVGLHAIPRPRPGLTADAAFEQAERIFTAICPNDKFLQVAEAVGDAIRAALGDGALDREPDDEEQVLESAVGMLQSASISHTPEVDEDEANL